MKSFILSSLILLSSAVTIPHLATASQVIYDYPVEVQTLGFQPYVPAYETNLPAGAIPIQLEVSGRLPSKSNQYQEGIIEGVSLPHPSVAGANLYQVMYLLDSIIYAVNDYDIKNPKEAAEALALAEVDEEGNIQFQSQWTADFQYREYRYTFQDKINALLFGIKVQNQEYLSLNLSYTKQR